MKNNGGSLTPASQQLTPLTYTHKSRKFGFSPTHSDLLFEPRATIRSDATTAIDETTEHYTRNTI